MKTSQIAVATTSKRENWDNLHNITREDTRHLNEKWRLLEKQNKLQS
jgi:hypothetical protein